MRLAFVMAFFVLLGARAGAADLPRPTPGPAEIVHVGTGAAQTLHRSAVPVSVLTRAQIAVRAAVSADALLAALPGFDRTRSNALFTNYGQLRISLSGAGNDRGLVLVDGFPAQDGFGGQVDWAALPPSQMVRAELLRDAGSALYGSGAIGGVLALTMAGPPSGPAPPGGSIAFGGGSPGAAEHGVSFSYGGSRVGLWAGLSSVREAYLDLPPSLASPVDHAAVATAQTAALRLRIGGPGAALVLGLRDAFDAQDEGRANYTQARVQRQYDARYANGALSAGLYRRLATVWNVADQYPAHPGALRYTQYVPELETGADAAWSFAGGASTYSVRADARRVSGVSQQFGPTGALQSGASGVQNAVGLAFQDVIDGPRTEIVAGLRGDRISTWGALSPRLAARIALSPRVAVRASAGLGFRAPFLNELLRGYQIGAVQYLPNAALRPERSAGLSAGIDLAGRTQFSFDVHRIRVSDAIAFVSLDATHQQRQNVGRTVSTGATATYGGSAGRCGTWTASVSNEDARVVAGPAADVGKQLPYVPFVSASAGFSRTFGAYAAGVTVRYLGLAYSDDRNAAPLPAAVLADLSVRRVVAGATLRLDVENALGARYLSSSDRYGPPRSVRLALALPLGASTASPLGATCP